MNKLKDTKANRSFIAFTNENRGEKCGKIEIKSTANGRD